MTPSQFSALVSAVTNNALKQATAGKTNYARRLATMFERSALMLRATGGGKPLWSTGATIRKQELSTAVLLMRDWASGRCRDAALLAEKYEVDEGKVESVIEYALDRMRAGKRTMKFTGKGGGVIRLPRLGN